MQSTLDVSYLPPSAHDVRAPVWWGNTLLMVIESTSMAMLIGTYFYIRVHFDAWPPVLVDRMPPAANPVPGLRLSTINVTLMLISIIPMLVADRAARKFDFARVWWSILAATALAITTVVVRYYEFQDLYFRWDDNAYGSLVWAILGMHYVYLWVGMLETVAVLGFISIHKFDENHSMDVMLTAAYWYWTVGVGALVYATVFWAPRLL